MKNTKTTVEDKAAKPLSKRATETLVVIDGFAKANGFSPSVRDIAERMGEVSTNAVHGWLVELETKGSIRRVKGVARSIVVVR